MALNPETVFRAAELPAGSTKRRSPSSARTRATKLKAGLSPHPEIIHIQQKFSIPVACFVFAVIGLALGLTVARDGKLAGFVVGIA